jgi:hypothetical protein
MEACPKHAELITIGRMLLGAALDGNYAERKEIRLARQLLYGVRLLRGKITKGSPSLPSGSLRRLVNVTRDTEINHNGSPAGHDDVARFQVSVNDPNSPEVSNCICDVVKKCSSTTSNGR